jgi:hypothetical protein
MLKPSYLDLCLGLLCGKDCHHLACGRCELVTSSGHTQSWRNNFRDWGQQYSRLGWLAHVEGSSRDRDLCDARDTG